MALQVHVTKTDIAHGVPGNARRCPIALAAIRTTGSACCVWQGQILVQGRSYLLPARARRFIERFDHEQPITPFRFTAASRAEEP